MLAGHCLLYIVTDICRRRSSSATLELKYIHIITSTGDRHFKFINIDDLEWPWIFPKEGF